MGSLEFTQRVLTSLQCGRQIAQLKEEYEETKKILEAEATKLRQVGVGETPMGRNAWSRSQKKPDCEGPATS